MSVFPTVEHKTDFCVVGGGLSGLCAAVAAARRGARVVLMQDRPMLGGNASSEVRMWVCGAHGRGNRETGIIEELLLENEYRNPYKNYSLWDGILYEIVRKEPGITLLLNCTCQDAAMEGRRIRSVTGWQMTTQRYHRVEAGLFADCSGDSILAPLTGADWRMGREARREFGEDIAPLEADARTMGMSCMIQAREETGPRRFTAPDWAEHFEPEDLPHRIPDMDDPMENFWYMELGGTRDTIGDTEQVRDELLALAYGMWDFVKNHPTQREKNANWELDWMGILPGKRESRRYLGDVIMTQNDVRSGGAFPDVVAYGGWSMDDHDPEGFRTHGVPTIYHPAPSPYGIPYRSLYSRNVENLFCAGRNISVTHTAMSSTRVMATCAILGQAVGTAAALAARHGLTPRGVYQEQLDALQQALLEDDCFLPGFAYRPGELTRRAHYSAGGGVLTDGVNRDREGEEHGFSWPLGETLTLSWDTPEPVDSLRLVMDSDLDRYFDAQGREGRPMLHNRPRNAPEGRVPATLLRAYRVEAVTEDGETVCLCQEEENHQRLRRIPVGRRVRALRLIPLATWGAEKCRLFALDVR